MSRYMESCWNNAWHCITALEMLSIDVIIIISVLTELIRLLQGTHRHLQVIYMELDAGNLSP